jgi:hypothetical protein
MRESSEIYKLGQVSEGTPMSQAELIVVLGIDRSTALAWQRLGMPFTRGEPGRENTYYLPRIVRWMAAMRGRL